jgi:hypothetical protein
MFPARARRRKAALDFWDAEVVQESPKLYRPRAQLRQEWLSALCSP